MLTKQKSRQQSYSNAKLNTVKPGTLGINKQIAQPQKIKLFCNFVFTVGKTLPVKNAIKTSLS